MLQCYMALSRKHSSNYISNCKYVFNVRDHVCDVFISIQHSQQSSTCRLYHPTTLTEIAVYMSTISRCVFLLLGCDKGTEARHFDGCNSQYHLLTLLDD